MLEADMLRQVLQGKALAAVQNNGNFPFRLGDEPFKVPTDGTIYGEFWIKTGKTTQMELGPVTGYECTVGILQFTLYGPEKFGEGALGRLGDNLKKAFNRKTWNVPPDGYVIIEPTVAKVLPGVKSGSKICIVDAGFDFYHRDPSATPS